MSWEDIFKADERKDITFDAFFSQMRDLMNEYEKRYRSDGNLKPLLKHMIAECTDELERLQ